MRFDVISLFPQIFSAVTQYGVTGRAYEKGLWQLTCWNPRDYTTDVHRTVDDRPYGGGPGMVMLSQPLERALADAQAAQGDAGPSLEHASPAKDAGPAQHEKKAPVVLLSPTGRPFTQEVAQQWTQYRHITLVCGRYEGIDQRFIDTHITHEYSLGDFVMSGGEFAALAMIDTAVRLLPGVLNHAQSAATDSFHEGLGGLLDSPHYTRPEVDEQQRSVPAVLRSGDHQAIARWRRQQSLLLSYVRRPDRVAAARQKGGLTAEDEQFLELLQTQGVAALTEALRDAPVSLPRRRSRS